MLQPSDFREAVQVHRKRTVLRQAIEKSRSAVQTIVRWLCNPYLRRYELGFSQRYWKWRATAQARSFSLRMATVEAPICLRRPRASLACPAWTAAGILDCRPSGIG